MPPDPTLPSSFAFAAAAPPRGNRYYEIAVSPAAAGGRGDLLSSFLCKGERAGCLGGMRKKCPGLLLDGAATGEIGTGGSSLGEGREGERERERESSFGGSDIKSNLLIGKE
jgi:hypothetical protein